MLCWERDWRNRWKDFCWKLCATSIRGFPAARVLAVDLPSGISADSGELIGEHMRADFSVTFTAPKDCPRVPARLRARG